MDEKLGVEAREANGRLDERLRTQRKSQLKRKSRNEESYRACELCDQDSSAPPTPPSFAPAATPAPIKPHSPSTPPPPHPSSSSSSAHHDQVDAVTVGSRRTSRKTNWPKGSSNPDP
ncbi:hypothetical protein ACFX1S_012916 [Malus domestica]